jgi:N-acylneuraminate cytidylyltransferase
LSKNIVAFIFARGGSKGVPGKNIRPIQGKPLIAHAIAAARNTPQISAVVVSTDDPAIAEVARAWGADVPFMRPADLAADDSPEWLAWRHALEQVQAARGPIDLFVSVPTVCPLRTSQDIARCIDRFEQGDADLVLTVVPARANPYYTLIEIDAADTPHLVKTPDTSLSGRQQAPKVYQIVAGCYVARPQFIMENMGIWSGRMRTVEIPEEHGVDIDTEMDFALAELLMARRVMAQPG